MSKIPVCRGSHAWNANGVVAVTGSGRSTHRVRVQRGAFGNSWRCDVPVRVSCWFGQSF